MKAALRPARARASLLGSVSLAAMTLALALPREAPAQTPNIPAAGGSGSEGLQEIVVTGTTSRRTILTASVDVTLITAADLEQRAPRSTADILDLVPGIFVESTAGPVSNNYSVRGFRGGGQSFITLEEDGMPIVYGGGGADEYFQNDITIGRVEAVEGGTSGILAPNGAGATINFITRKYDHDDVEGQVRVLGATYGEQRIDAYVSSPLSLVGSANDIAFLVGGYFDHTHGVRDSPFTYDTYHFKAGVEKTFENGGYVRFTWRRWNEHDPYYADQPYAFSNGQIGGIAGLDPQHGNILGPAFANIKVPDSPATGQDFRIFSGAQGIYATGSNYRADVEVPLTDTIGLFAKVRYLTSDWDFNGIFPGSGSGNAGLTSAVNYLNPGSINGTAISPVQSLLTSGLTAFPGTTQFGLREVSTGRLIPASAVGTLNGLNGNGLIQQTVLNQQLIRNRDFGADFGARFNLEGNGWKDSLTIGGMYYKVRQYNDQSAVSTLLNDVRSGSSPYDVVALNSAGTVLGSLTNNGLISYGNWGAGISKTDIDSLNAYFNNEATIAEDWHVDAGMRFEQIDARFLNGNSLATNLPVPAGYAGIIPDIGSSFDGTYSNTTAKRDLVSYTAGINYTINQNLSAYVRYAYGNQTQGQNPPTYVSLYEAGVKFNYFGAVGSLVYFRTQLDNQIYGFINPANPAINGNFHADTTTNGIDLDFTYRPKFDLLKNFSIAAQLTYQQPELANVTIDGIASPQYEGNTPERTPQWLWTITPAYDLPNNLGQIYLRYQHIGSIFADSGNGLALPAYDVVSIGGFVNITDNLQFNVSVENVNDELGLTEGNPRQGNTQSIVNGYFYGRGIVGTNAQLSLTYKF